MEYYEKTDLFHIIQDKVRELDKKCIVLVAKKENSYSSHGYLGVFGGLSQFIEEDLAKNGFSIVSFNKKDPKLIFDTLKKRSKDEHDKFYCCLLDKNGEIIEEE
jgi:hypothetical protein